MTDIGERLIEALAAAGIDAIFGVPGGQTLPLYRAARAAGFRHVLMRDERTAACAADAYARVRGGIGVCDATVGPGVTNLISGLAEAYASSIPVLAIVADIRTDQGHLRRRGVVSQAIEQSALLAPVTKWVARVERSTSFDDVFSHALRVATTGRPGPVALEIPEDVFVESLAGGPAAPRVQADSPRFRPALAASDIDRIGALLASAGRPLLLAGGGVLASGACDALRAFVEATGIPVATTIMGKGALDERHELSLGVVGTFGCIRAGAALIEADAVLVVGSKLDQVSTIGFRTPRAGQRLAHVDIDGEEIGRVTPVEVGAVADAREALTALRTDFERAGTTRRDPWISRLPAEPDYEAAVHDDGVAPEAVVTAISDTFPAGATLVSDASLASGWAARYFRVGRAGRSFLAPRGLAGIGWAGGAAVGASVAVGGRGRVIALAGDGAWGYTMAEVETAARAALPITYVILNNAAYGWITHVENDLQLNELSHLGQADYAAAASALGAKAWRVDSIEDFAQAFALATTTEGPTVVEVLSSPSASPTLRVRDLLDATRATGSLDADPSTRKSAYFG